MNMPALRDTLVGSGLSKKDQRKWDAELEELFRSTKYAELQIKAERYIGNVAMQELVLTYQEYETLAGNNPALRELLLKPLLRTASNIDQIQRGGL